MGVTDGFIHCGVSRNDDGVSRRVVANIIACLKSGREVAESTVPIEAPLMRKSLVFKHAPGVIRTHNLLIRSQMLYPIELRVRKDRQANVKAREVKQTAKRCFLAFVCP